MRRATACAVSIVYALVVTATVLRPLPALAATCSLGPGKDGSPGTLSGVYNTYYQPPAGTLGAGSTVVPLGTLDTGGGGANTAVAANDLLLIVQMQDGSFTSSNSASYGSGSGSGYTSLGQAGLYEYVAVQSVAGGNATILGTGAGNGLINTYVESAANGTHGQQTYQIVRVPQYVNATLSSTFHAAYWNGKTGGVAALDVASTLNLGGANVYATGGGFRGGGLTKSGVTAASALNSDWVASATMNGASAPGFGSKGEGIVGTPDYLFQYTNFTTPSTPAAPTVTSSGADGYPGGDQARGAPGNAGGGGTDMNPAANDENTGGGGGGNGGSGGAGGYPWTPQGYSSGNNPSYYVSVPGQHTATSTTAAPPDATHDPDIGGRGGAALAPSVSRLFMGGGGGAGSNNNGSNNNASNAYGSSGGVGGGMVLMRIADASGASANIYAQGTTGLAPDNDGGGGGGAGGTVEITSPNSFTGITVHADGAAGTTAAATASDTTFGIQHGPGGGGGGGAVLSSSPVAATVAGGANGTTTTNATSYGATAGSSGVSMTISAAQVPGVASGAECYSGGSGGSLFNGPVGGNATTGSYDGTVPATNNNDFTARGFFPAGATLGNTGTTPGDVDRYGDRPGPDDGERRERVRVQQRERRQQAADADGDRADVAGGLDGADLPQRGRRSELHHQRALDRDRRRGQHRDVDVQCGDRQQHDRLLDRLQRARRSHGVQPLRRTDLHHGRRCEQQLDARRALSRLRRAHQTDAGADHQLRRRRAGGHGLPGRNRALDDRLPRRDGGRRVRVGRRERVPVDDRRNVRDHRGRNCDLGHEFERPEGSARRGGDVFGSLVR